MGSTTPNPPDPDLRQAYILGLGLAMSEAGLGPPLGARPLFATLDSQLACAEWWIHWHRPPSMPEFDKAVPT